MAIKGKSKSKHRHAAPRAPRKDPVPVPVPFYRRTRVQWAGFFLLGALGALFAVWIVASIGSQGREADAEQRASDQRVVLQGWTTALEGAIGNAGTVGQGLPPTLVPELTSAIDQVAKGSTPQDLADVASTASTQLKAATSAIEDYAVATKISSSGAFESDLTGKVIRADQDYLAALALYAQAADLAGAAADAPPAQAAALGASAKAVVDLANERLVAAYDQQQQVLAPFGLQSNIQTGIGGLDQGTLGG
jgi:hypothetical protein